MSIYKGVLLFSQTEQEKKTEYATKIAIDLDEIKEVSEYCYPDNFLDFPHKTWLKYHSDEIILIAENFEVIYDLWIKRRINPKIFISESIKKIKFEEPNNN